MSDFISMTHFLIRCTISSLCVCFSSSLTFRPVVCFDFGEVGIYLFVAALALHFLYWITLNTAYIIWIPMFNL